MKRNIDEKAETETVWKGNLESKTIICPKCGKPAGNGKFCNNCGASMALVVCSKCGKENAQGVKFCNYCGAKLATTVVTKCPNCHAEVASGMKFCGNCGTDVTK